MAARSFGPLTIAGVALALALAAPAARAQGPDLTVMSGSVLSQDWAFGEGVPDLVIPQGFGNGAFQFPNEMSALSWNFQTLVVLWSGDFDADDPYALYDPSDPATSHNEGKCSFLQPQYCSLVQALFGIVSPPPSPPAVARLPTPGWVRGGGSRGGTAAASAARMRGRPAPQEPEPPLALPAPPPRRVEPHPGRPLPPPTRGPFLPDGTLPEEFPSRPDGIRDGGNASFGRRDFVWHQETPPGCLPPRSGLSGLSGSRIGTSAAAQTRSQRLGRCPPR